MSLGALRPHAGDVRFSSSPSLQLAGASLGLWSFAIQLLPKIRSQPWVGSERRGALWIGTSGAGPQEMPTRDPSQAAPWEPEPGSAGRSSGGEGWGGGLWGPRRPQLPSGGGCAGSPWGQGALWLLWRSSEMCHRALALGLCRSCRPAASIPDSEAQLSPDSSYWAAHTASPSAEQPRAECPLAPSRSSLVMAREGLRLGDTALMLCGQVCECAHVCPCALCVREHVHVCEHVHTCACDCMCVYGTYVCMAPMHVSM